MMDNPYRDAAEGMFIPTYTITKRPDNGHYEVTVEGTDLKVTHHDQSVAMDKMNEKVQEALLRGELHA